MRIISTLILITFIIQDTAWAYPDISSIGRSGSYTLATQSIFKADRDSQENIDVEFIRNIIDENAHLAPGIITMPAIRDVLERMSVWLGQRGISYSPPAGTREVVISLPSGRALRYFDPAVAGRKLASGYREERFEELRFVHKQVLAPEASSQGQKTRDGTIAKGVDALATMALQLEHAMRDPRYTGIDDLSRFNEDLLEVETRARSGARGLMGVFADVRFLATAAVVVSRQNYAFGFNPNVPTVKKIITPYLAGGDMSYVEEQFDRMFPGPTVVLSREMLAHPDPSVRQEYLYHELRCYDGRHYSVIFEAQRLWPENYEGDPREYSQELGLKYLPGYRGRADKPYKGKLGKVLREIINARAPAPQPKPAPEKPKQQEVPGVAEISQFADRLISGINFYRGLEGLPAVTEADILADPEQYGQTFFSHVLDHLFLQLGIDFDGAMPFIEECRRTLYDKGIEGLRYELQGADMLINVLLDLFSRIQARPGVVGASVGFYKKVFSLIAPGNDRYLDRIIGIRAGVGGDAYDAVRAWAGRMRDGFTELRAAWDTAPHPIDGPAHEAILAITKKVREEFNKINYIGLTKDEHTLVLHDVITPIQNIAAWESLECLNDFDPAVVSPLLDSWIELLDKYSRVQQIVSVMENEYPHIDWEASLKTGFRSLGAAARQEPEDLRQMVLECLGHYEGVATCGEVHRWLKQQAPDEVDNKIAELVKDGTLELVVSLDSIRSKKDPGSSILVAAGLVSDAKKKRADVTPVTRAIIHDLKNKLNLIAYCDLIEMSGQDARDPEDLADIALIREYQQVFEALSGAATGYFDRKAGFNEVSRALADYRSGASSFKKLQEVLASSVERKIELGEVRRIIDDNLPGFIRTTEAVKSRLESGGFAWNEEAREMAGKLVMESASSLIPLAQGAVSWMDRSMMKVDVGDFIAETAAMAKISNLISGDIAVDIKIDESLERAGELFTYKLIAKMLLDELLYNATKYSESRKIEIRSSVTEAGELMVEVADFGKGMSREAMESIVRRRPFTEAKDARHGTGVGILSLQEAVESLGGSLNARNEAGRGAVVTFTVPVNAPLDAVARPRLEEPVIVTVGGLRGAGRRAVAQWLAARFGLQYINGGFLMRVLLYKMLEDNARGASIDLADHLAVARYVDRLVRSNRLDYLEGMLKVDGVDTTEPEGFDGLALRDRIKTKIDKNEVNTKWLHRIAGYDGVKRAVDAFLKEQAASIMKSGRYNGVVIRVTEPISSPGVINIMLDAPIEERAKIAKAEAAELDELDGETGRKDMRALYPNEFWVDASKMSAATYEGLLGFIAPKIRMEGASVVTARAAPAKGPGAIGEIDTLALDLQGLADPPRSSLRLMQSYSGVRGRFGTSASISENGRLVALAYAYTYAATMIERWRAAEPHRKTFTVALGRDPRPTGEILRRIHAVGLLMASRDKGADIAITDLGVISTPLLESAIRSFGLDGGVMITASHNPLSDNGFKYMTGAVEPEQDFVNRNGSILNSTKMADVITGANAILSAVSSGNFDFVRRANAFLRAHPELIHNIAPPADSGKNRNAAMRGYIEKDIAQGIFRLADDDIGNLRTANTGTAAVIDCNGGGACGISAEVLRYHGYTAVEINGVPGKPRHRIEPGGAAMRDAEAAMRTAGAAVGVVEDFDADRGIKIVRDGQDNVRPLTPQDEAYLNLASMIAWIKAHIDRYDEARARAWAVVVDGAASSRVWELCRTLGIEVFEVDNGETNIVTRMRRLEGQGYFVPAGIEAYNGGTILFGSEVRDGTLNTLLYLLVRSDRKAAENLDRYMQIAGYHTLQGEWTVAAAFSDAAAKTAITANFRKRMLPAQDGEGFSVQGLPDKIFTGYGIVIHESTDTMELTDDRMADKGAFKIVLTDEAGDRHFMWFRSSRTEPGLLRLCVDSKDPLLAAALEKLQEALCAEAAGRQATPAQAQADGAHGAQMLRMPVPLAPPSIFSDDGWRAEVRSVGWFNTVDEARRAVLSSWEELCFARLNKVPSIGDLKGLAKTGNLEVGLACAEDGWYLVKGVRGSIIIPFRSPLFKLHSHPKKITREIEKARDEYMFPGPEEEAAARAQGVIEYVLSDKGLCAYGGTLEKPVLAGWKELAALDMPLVELHTYFTGKQVSSRAVPLALTAEERAVGDMIMHILGVDAAKPQRRAEGIFVKTTVPASGLRADGLRTIFNIPEETVPDGIVSVLSCGNAPVCIYMEDSAGIRRSLSVFKYYLSLDGARSAALAREAGNIVKRAEDVTPWGRYSYVVFDGKGGFVSAYSSDPRTSGAHSKTELATMQVYRVPVLPGVFAGTHETSYIAARETQLRARKGSRVLVAGTGIGVEAAVAARKGAVVDAMDNMATAAFATNALLALVGIKEGVRVFSTDKLFEGLGEYDLIVFNMPHVAYVGDVAGRPITPGERNSTDFNGELLEKVASTISAHLAAGGTAVIVNDKMPDVKKILEERTGLAVGIGITGKETESQAYIITKPAPAPVKTAVLAAAERPEAGSARALGPTTGKKRILVVDDEDSIRKLFKTMLVRFGYDVETASGVDDALGRLAQRRFDMIITDCRMPVKNGDELVSIVKARNENLPVIMITGFSADGADLSRVDSVLHKPVRVEDLKQAVTGLFAEYAARVEAGAQGARRMTPGGESVAEGEGLRAGAGAATRAVDGILKETHELASAAMKAHPLADNAQIILSEGLFSPEDANQLRSVLRGAFGEQSPIRILPADRIESAVNARPGQDKAACVVGKADFDANKAWYEERKATVLVLGQDLKGDRYLHIEGVVALARAMMAGDAGRDMVERFVSVLFREVDGMDSAALAAELMKDPRGLADRMRFRPVDPADIEGLDRHNRIAVETYLTAA